MQRNIKDIKASNKLNAIRHKVLVFANKLNGFKPEQKMRFDGFESLNYKQLTGMLGSLKEQWYKTDDGKKRIASITKQVR